MRPRINFCRFGINVITFCPHGLILEIFDRSRMATLFLADVKLFIIKLTSLLVDFHRYIFRMVRMEFTDLNKL